MRGLSAVTHELRVMASEDDDTLDPVGVLQRAASQDDVIGREACIDVFATLNVNGKISLELVNIGVWLLGLELSLHILKVNIIHSPQQISVGDSLF